jgi:hypothetical protein
MVLLSTENTEMNRLSKTAQAIPGVPANAADLADKYVSAPLAHLGGSSIDTQSPFTNAKVPPLHLTPLQWRSTFDEDFKKKHPSIAAVNAINDPHDYKLGMPYGIGKGIKNLVSGSKSLSSILDKGPFVGGLASIIPGALVSALGTGAYNMATGRDLTEGMLPNALIGGGLGGALGAWGGHLRTTNIPEASPDRQRLITDQEMKKRRDAERAIVERQMPIIE